MNLAMSLNEYHTLRFDVCVRLVFFFVSVSVCLCACVLFVRISLSFVNIAASKTLALTYIALYRVCAQAFAIGFMCIV